MRAFGFLLLLASLAIQADPPLKPIDRSSSSCRIVGVNLVNVNVRSPANAIRTNMTILIEGDQIADIRSTTSDDLASLAAQQQGHESDPVPTLVDGRGLYAVPGLIDTDVHLQTDGNESVLLRTFLANGVTAILDAGNASPRIYQWRRQSLSKFFVGPRIEVSGPFITARPTPAPGMTVVTTTQDAQRDIRSRVAGGAEFASIAASLPPALSYDVIRLAERRGIRVIGHLGQTNALEATAFGISIIATLSGVPDSAVPDPERVRVEHIKGSSEGWLASNNAWLRADSAQLTELIRHLVANHVALSPSLWFQKTFATQGEDTVEKRDAVGFSYAPKDILNRWGQFDLESNNAEVYRGAWNHQVSFVKSFVQSGGWLITGSDSSHTFDPPGFALHLEMETLEAAGITPFQVLRAATVLASRALGHEEEYGSIEIGNRADLLLIDGNPIEDIKNTRHIRRVFRSGIAYDPKDLLRGLPR